MGDVVGEPGREAVAARLGEMRHRWGVDMVVVNGENVAGGRGITPKLCIGLMRAGAAVVTTGDHVWDQREILGHLEIEPRLLRPANYPAGAPGAGVVVLPGDKGRVAVINLQGRTFMRADLECPFLHADRILAELEGEADLIFVDFHAEATSEKVAMGWHLDGRVGAVVGTHTHVQTADERILPGGTAYLTDVGMCGAEDSVIGSEVGPVLEKFRTQLPVRFGMARGRVRLCGVLVDIDPGSGLATGIWRVQEVWENGKL